MDENQRSYSTSPLLRWYIDTRALTSTTTSLPLIETLQPTDQEKARKFYHLKDKHMSLASTLLKYLFIHRTCGIPWGSITISHTPEPHRRPCFIPTATQISEHPAIPAVEFNVSHQASLVALVGTTISNPATNNPPQVGVDITCVNERQNKPATRTELNSYADIFTEVFSTREIDAIKSLNGFPPAAVNDDRAAVDYGYRLFFTYWALKEAYIKMTGEALLASWLRELEFTNVVAPAAVDGDNELGEAYTGVRTELHRDLVTNVRIEVVSMGKDYLLATATNGQGVGPHSATHDGDGDTWLPFRAVDIEQDIRPCATGTCQCLRGI